MRLFSALLRAAGTTDEVRRALAMSEQLEAGQAGMGAIVEFLAQDVVARHLMAVDRAFFPLIGKAAALAA